jgi:hypothetical protein
MPGRTPQDALRAYTDPLQRAVSCLPGSGKILLGAARVKKVGDEGAWLLNGDEGLHVPQLGILRARQHFRLVDTDVPRFGSDVGKFRVTTLSYLYSLRLEKSDHEIRWHWHPSGSSQERRPHMHLSFVGEAHLPCARHTFEDVVESCIEISGGNASSDDWRDRLDESRSLHTEHRSWVNWPRARTAMKEIVDEAQQRLRRR